MSWQRLEQDIKRSVGGYIPPGSGNKGIKGDIRFLGGCIEAKYSSKLSTTIQLGWLSRLEELFLKEHLELVALVVRVNTHTHCYVINKTIEDGDEVAYSNRHVEKDDAPLFIAGKDFLWERVSLVDLAIEVESLMV